MFDEIWYFQFARLLCKNGNDQHTKDSYFLSFSLDKSKSKGIIADENLLQVCYKDDSKSERDIVNESSTEDIELKRVHTSINTN